MNNYVNLYWKKNRTWPWPEDSYGLTPIFGEDGWCRSCGVPQHEQTGALILQAKNQRATGAWVPNWLFDVICMEASLATELQEKFGVSVREVQWHGKAPGSAAQLVIPVTAHNWYDADELGAATLARHGTAGATCLECRVWRWMPLMPELMPPLRWVPGPDAPPVLASPEWFGDGWNAFHQLIFRRDLAEAIAAASPRDFKVDELR